MLMKSLLIFWSGFNVTLSEHWICPHDPRCLCEAPLKRWRFMVKYISDDWFLHQYKARLDVWLTRRCRKMLTFTLWVAVLRAVLIFQTPLLFKDQRSISLSSLWWHGERETLVHQKGKTHPPPWSRVIDQKRSLLDSSSPRPWLIEQLQKQQISGAKYRLQNLDHFSQ